MLIGWIFIIVVIWAVILVTILRDEQEYFCLPSSLLFAHNNSNNSNHCDDTRFKPGQLFFSLAYWATNPSWSLEEICCVIFVSIWILGRGFWNEGSSSIEKSGQRGGSTTSGRSYFSHTHTHNKRINSLPFSLHCGSRNGYRNGPEQACRLESSLKV